jgi:hypothetical protein
MVQRQGAGSRPGTLDGVTLGRRVTAAAAVGEADIGAQGVASGKSEGDPVLPCST